MLSPRSQREPSPQQSSLGSRHSTKCASSSSLAKEETPYQAQYREVIRLCFRNYPEAFHYYGQLDDHLKESSGVPASCLQTAKFYVYDVLPREQTGVSNAFPFTVADCRSEHGCPRVAILEGYPSPENVAFLGVRWKIRPEFFIEHLTQGQIGRSQVRTLYELPTLPSLQDNLVRVSFVGIVQSFIHQPLKGSLSPRRLELERICQKYNSDLFFEKRYGATRFRRINLHDNYFSSVEQSISMTVSRDGSSWCVLCLTDQGRSLTLNPRLPWSAYNPKTGRPIGEIPIIPYNHVADLACNYDDPQGKNPDGPALLDQFHPLKRIFVKDAADHDLLISDPFFILASILRTSIMSWNQLLNVINECLTVTRSETVDTYGKMLTRLDQLRYHIDVMHQIRESVSRNLIPIEQGGCSSWPKACDPIPAARKAEIQQQLRADYSHVLDRCTLMVREFESSITALVSLGQLQTAERGMVEAVEVRRLTVVALVFVPLTFAASLFQMDFNAWQNPYAVVAFFASAVFISAVTFLVLYRDWWWARCAKFRLKLARQSFDSRKGPAE